MSSLTKISEQFGVAVWVTNQVMSTPVRFSISEPLERIDLEPVNNEKVRV